MLDNQIIANAINKNPRVGTQRWKMRETHTHLFVFCVIITLCVCEPTFYASSRSWIFCHEDPAGPLISHIRLKWHFFVSIQIPFFIMRSHINTHGSSFSVISILMFFLCFRISANCCTNRALFLLHNRTLKLKEFVVFLKPALLSLVFGWYIFRTFISTSIFLSTYFRNITPL